MNIGEEKIDLRRDSVKAGELDADVVVVPYDTAVIAISQREQAAAENAARAVLAAVEQANLKITKPEGTEGWYYAATAAGSAAAPFLKGE